MTHRAGLENSFRRQFGAPIDRREFIRRTGLVGLALGAPAVLAACGGNRGEGAATQRAATETAARSAPAGGTLRFGPTWDFVTLDPAVYPPDATAWAVDGVIEGLTTYIPGTEWEMANSLAETVEMSDDGTRIAFTLKEGVPFHEGYGEVTAEDVKFSFERAAGKQKLFPDAGEEDVAAFATDWSALDQVRVTGKYSGEIVLTEPFTPISTITLSYASSGLIVSKKAVEEKGRAFGQSPIGTGPYRVVSWQPGKEMVVERFEEYAGGEAGTIFDWDEIRYLIDPNARGENTSTVALEAGDVDVTPTISGQDAERLQGRDDITVHTSSTLSYEFMSINVQNPKLSDTRVREAIRYAVDVPALIALAGASADEPAYALISEDMGVGYWSDAPRYEQDLDRARSLMAEAGVDSLDLDLNSERRRGELIQASLAEIGINCTIIEPANVPDSWATDPSVAALTYTQFSGAPDPYYQFTWFTCDQVKLWNYAFWCDERFDELYRELGRESDRERRDAISIEMQQNMDESAGFVWAHYPSTNFASRSDIEVVFDPAGGPHPAHFRAA
jgi:peptide/nickel transport system substrate-binding protein